jgi:serine/threonine protein phosphatase 1
MLRSFGCAAADEIPKAYIEYMARLPYYFELEGYLLVHAGLNFSAPDPLQDLDQMVWIRNWYEHIDRDWLGGRLIVHGHTPLQKPAILRCLDTLDEVPAINIDNGCVFDFTDFGSLCALDLTNRRLFFQKKLDR